MHPSPGPSSTPSLTVHIASSDHATRITVRGRADDSNRARLGRALAAVDVTAATRVELTLRLDFCDVETVQELLAFASEVCEHDGHVVLVGATTWVLAMLRLLDAEGVITIPPLDSDRPTEGWLTTDLDPGEAAALRHLLTALEHDGASASSHLLPDSDGAARGDRDPDGPHEVS